MCLLKNNYTEQIEELRAGIRVKTEEDTRWKHCHIKTTNLLPNILLFHEGLNAGFQDVILHKDNIVTEGIKANVFVIKNNTLYTPINDDRIVNGITRNLILNLADNIETQERNITREEIYNADEVWLSNSTCDIVPVVKIDGHSIGHNKPGPVYHKMRQKLLNYMDNYIVNQNKAVTI